MPSFSLKRTSPPGRRRKFVSSFRSTLTEPVSFFPVFRSNGYNFPFYRQKVPPLLLPGADHFFSFRNRVVARISTLIRFLQFLRLLACMINVSGVMRIFSSFPAMKEYLPFGRGFLSRVTFSPEGVRIRPPPSTFRGRCDLFCKRWTSCTPLFFPFRSRSFSVEAPLVCCAGLLPLFQLSTLLYIL